MGWYEAALAQVHHERFVALARAASADALQLLPPPGDCAPIVDLGCGSGETARVLTSAGYSVHGIDVSPAMIELAEQNAPAAIFELDSIYQADIPDCQAVLAIGEIFNYETDDRTDNTLNQLWARIAAALRPGGVLLFDVAAPGRAGATPPEAVLDTDDWTLWHRAAEDPELGSLTRRIVTFTRHGAFDRSGTTYQRHDETHVLQLLDDSDVHRRLSRTGLEPQRLPGYQGHDLGEGWSVWLARKPQAPTSRAPGSG